MPDSPEDLTRLMSNFTLNQPTRGSTTNEKLRQEGSLYADLQALASNASGPRAEVKEAQAVGQDRNAPLSRRVAATGSVLKRSAEIARMARDLEDATVSNIMSHLLSLHGNRDVRKLLLHFESKLETIIKNTYKAAGWGLDSMVKILEACYTQALTGDLHVENYFIPLHEASLESPYDPDFESEAYYEHENRLQVDEGYAEAESMREQRKSKQRDKDHMSTHRAWVGFWVRMLHGCEDGPTLFWPYPANHGIEDLPDVPRYLFRAFDDSSSGKSDEHLVASSTSMHQKEDSQVDLLSLDAEVKAQRLYTHLKKTCFGAGFNTDNLMSWSSSMLFVLQYAIWRCSKGHRTAAGTYICVVDTTKFPRGQFARDTWLLQQCRGKRNEYPGIEDVIQLRERGYDNGEYLSQGLLVHQNRSAVTTLENLIQSGLYKLYPELDGAAGKQGWTNRVRDLRLAWEHSRSTSHEELQRASQIATTCFGGVQTSELAICLLTLKSRILKDGSPKGTMPLTGR